MDGHSQVMQHPKMAQRPAQQGPRGNFKLLVDPMLKKGHQKLVRFNGETYSCENHGQGPVVVRDPRPRISRLWSKRERVDLPVPRYKIDEFYVGAIPPREITFSKLNDNVTKQFMEHMCEKFGKLERVRVYYHPKTSKHMGLAKVVFASMKSAAQCIESLHQTSIMGNIIHAVIDSKGDILKRLHHKIMKGELIAETMPDVIRHTQEKPNIRPVDRNTRRKSSQDDPRRRQSTDSMTDHSVDHTAFASNGPRTPTMDSVHPSTPPMENQPPNEQQSLGFHPSQNADLPKKEAAASNARNHEMEKPLHQVPPLRIPSQPFHSRDQINAQSLESGYGSHPGSATLAAEPPSPLLAEESEGEIPGSVLFESTKDSCDLEEPKPKHDEALHKKHKKKHKKKKKHDGSRRDYSDNESEPEIVSKPVWSKDLESRIDSMLSEQNQKFNLKDTRRKEKTKSRRHSRTSESGRRHSSSHLRRQSFEKFGCDKHASFDLEDGECSGDELESDTSHAATNSVSNKPVARIDSGSEPGLASPTLLPEMNKSSRGRFSRSPSPRPGFPPPHSFERGPHPADFERRHNIRRSPELPGHQDSYRFRRFHHPGSPRRHSPAFDHHPFHHEHRAYDHHRRRSPSFDGHRRGRSPGFERHFRHHSPFHGRPPSPGFLRRHEPPPNHPDFHRRGMHPRRSVSPPHRRGSPEIGVYEDARHERFINRRHSPPKFDRHRRGPSPPIIESRRRDRHSPVFIRDDFRPPSPEFRRQRDSDLPQEFVERLKMQRSPSPGTMRGPAVHIRNEARFVEKNDRFHHQSRSTSPHSFSPRRMRSPVRLSQDQKPYSPSDLTLEDSSHTDGPDVILNSATTDFGESDAPGGITAAKRKQRESSDQDPPQLSLDERLREITGEPPPDPPSDHEDVEDQKSRSGSLDMEISSGHSDAAGSPKTMADTNDMDMRMHKPFSDNRFRAPFPGAPHQREHWNYPHGHWSHFDQRMQMPGHHPGMWSHPGFHPDHRTHMNGYPYPPGFHPGAAHRPDVPFDPKMLPPPPPGWNRPWVQAGQPLPPGSEFMPPPNFTPSNEDNIPSPNRLVSHCVLNRISGELKEIIKRDIDRKVIVTMAFKVYESWWDSQNQVKVTKPTTTVPVTANKAATIPDIKKEDVADKENKPVQTKPSSKLPALLNTFDPLNWAKGSLEMDGFRIGLGLRSAISKMPSFRVKKRSPSPVSVIPDKKSKMSEKNKAKIEQSKLKRKKINQQLEKGRKRRVLDSEGEDEEESEVESSDEDEESKKQRVRLDVDDVFSSSASSSSEEEEDDDEDDDEPTEEEDSDAETDSDFKETDKDEGIADKDDRVRSLKRSSIMDDEDDLLEPSKKKIKSEGNLPSFDSTQGDYRSDGEGVKLAAPQPDLGSQKLTSPLLPPSVPAGADLTPQNLKHVHPKKRFRALSKEETRNLDLIAEVSGRLRSDDEISMSEKEKAALKILTDMKSTPERRHSSAARLSESSESSEQPVHPPTPGGSLGEGVFSPPITPLVPRRTSANAEGLLTPNHVVPSTPGGQKHPEDSRKSGSEELEAVEALLSIKQSQAPLTSVSPPQTTEKKRKQKVKKQKVEPPPPRLSLLTKQQRQHVIDIAEEHSYFRPLPGDRHKWDMSKPESVPRQIADEHLYSSPPSLLAAHAEGSLFDTDATLWSELSAAEISSTSAAERVKLRRESKDSTKKSRKPRPAVDDRRPPAAVRFRQRDEHQEMAILYLMWSTGLDLEDMKLLRAEYEHMLTRANAPQWVNETHWVPHPVTNIPDTDPDEPVWTWERRARNRRKKKKNDPNAPKVHKTGCSRSEGYYKLTDKSKLIQRRLMYRQADNAIKPGSRRGLEATNAPTEKSREARHMMRRIASEFGSDVSDLLKYNQLMFRKKSVKFARSSIHGWGLFAQETIGADEMVIEYVGELVRSFVADRREVIYTKRGIGSSYLFRIDSDHIIDATKCGNYARFMNHSCNPSCYAKVITVEGAKKIVIYSKDVIKPQEEITYDYKFPIEDVKIPCFCGSVNCRGTLN